MKVIFVITSLSLSNFLYCQNILIEFDLKFNALSFKNELTINDSISCWNDISKNSTFLLEISFFIKDHRKNFIYLTDGIFHRTFYIKDSLHSMKWQLTNDTKIILDEKCNSATTHFRGRNYIVYYTTSLPYSDGPWKFGGLPGVILEVKSDDNLYQFNAVKIIKNYTERIEPVKINNYKFLQWDEYVNKFIDSVDKFIKLTRSDGTIGDNGTVKLKIDAPEIIYPKVQTGVGVSF